MYLITKGKSPSATDILAIPIDLEGLQNLTEKIMGWSYKRCLWWCTFFLCRDYPVLSRVTVIEKIWLSTISCKGLQSEKFQPFLFFSSTRDWCLLFCSSFWKLALCSSKLWLYSLMNRERGNGSRRRRIVWHTGDKPMVHSCCIILMTNSHTLESIGSKQKIQLRNKCYAIVSFY